MSINLFYIISTMKNDAFIGVCLPKEIKEVIQKAARKDKRTLSWTTRELIVAALKRKGLLKSKAAKRKKK